MRCPRPQGYIFIFSIVGSHDHFCSGKRWIAVPNYMSVANKYVDIACSEILHLNVRTLQGLYAINESTNCTCTCIRPTLLCVLMLYSSGLFDWRRTVPFSFAQLIHNDGQQNDSQSAQSWFDRLRCGNTATNVEVQQWRDVCRNGK